MVVETQRLGSPPPFPPRRSATCSYFNRIEWVFGFAPPFDSFAHFHSSSDNTGGLSTSIKGRKGGWAGLDCSIVGSSWLVIAEESLGR